MKTDDDLSLVEKGQERQTVTMRAKVHWALVGMTVLGVVPGLMFANSPVEIAAAYRARHSQFWKTW